MALYRFKDPSGGEVELNVPAGMSPQAAFNAYRKSIGGAQGVATSEQPASSDDPGGFLGTASGGQTLEQGYQQLQNKTVENLPAIGATAAGMATGGMGFLPGVGLTGLGSVVGGLAKQQIQEPGAMPEPKRIGLDFLAAAGPEALMRGVGGTLKSIIAPSAGRLGPAAKQSAKLITEFDLPGAGDFTEGPIPSAVKFFAKFFPGGRAVHSAYRGRAQARLSTWGKGLVDDIFGIVGRTDDILQPKVRQAVLDAKSGDKIYKIFNDAIGEVNNVALNTTKQFIEDNGGLALLDKMGFSSLSKEGKQVHATVKRLLNSNGVVPSDEARFLISRVFRAAKGRAGFGGLGEAQKGIRDTFKKTMLDDLELVHSVKYGQTVATLKKEADVIFGKISEWFKSSPVAQRLVSKNPFGSGDVLSDIFHKNNASGLSAMRDIIVREGGQETWDGLTARFIDEKIIKPSLTTLDKATGETVLQPATLVALIDEAEPVLKQIGGGVWQKIKGFRDIAAVTKTAIELPSDIAGWAAGTGGSTALYFAGGPKMVAGVNAVSAAMAWMIMGTDKMARVFQRWLGKDAMSDIAKSLLKSGGVVGRPGLMLGAQQMFEPAEDGAQ